MEKVIATGVQDFEKLRVNQRFYVDKTDFISKWWNGGDDVTLITRPRRFGKTLNMSTLNCFFSNKFENRGELFEGLKVWENADMREQQGKWPVIFLSLADIKQKTYELTRRSFNQLFVDLYTSYAWLLDKEIYTEADREFFKSVRVDMTNNVAAVSIKKLCEWLYRYYGKKFWFCWMNTIHLCRKLISTASGMKWFPIPGPCSTVPSRPTRLWSGAS